MSKHEVKYCGMSQSRMASLQKSLDNIPKEVFEQLCSATGRMPIEDFPAFVEFHTGQLPSLGAKCVIDLETLPQPTIIFGDYTDIELRALVNMHKHSINFGIGQEKLQEFGVQLGLTARRFQAIKNTFEDLHGACHIPEAPADPTKSWWENKSQRHAGDGHMSHIKREKARLRRKKRK